MGRTVERRAHEHAGELVSKRVCVIEPVSGPRAGASIWTMTALIVAALVLVLGAAAFVPTFLREDLVTYEWSRSWGTSGSEPGQFRGPIGIAVDDSGFVYISDSGNDRVQKFTTGGEFVASWGESGTGAGQLRRPMHLDLVDDTLLYVAEYLNDRIQIFRLDGTPAGLVTEEPEVQGGELDAPGGVAAPRTGDVVWVPDFFNHRVAVFDRDGGYRTQVGSAGRGIPGRFHYPTDVAFGPDGTAYVADAYNNRIQRFSPDGERLDTWGGPLGLGIPGPWKGWFKVATGVHAGPGGRVFVADFYNHRVQAFGPSGGFVTEWGSAGSGAGMFDRPTDVATDGAGNVYVVDFGNDRIQVFTCASCEPG